MPDGASPQLPGADLLVWTTTPWTLVANTAVAVHPDETYVVARRSADGDRVVVAEALVRRVLGDGWHIAARVQRQPSWPDRHTGRRLAWSRSTARTGW